MVSGSPASKGIAMAASPISSATRFAASSLRSATATFAPSCTKRRAVAAPILPPPPVMIATLPARRCIYSSPSFMISPQSVEPRPASSIRDHLGLIESSGSRAVEIFFDPRDLAVRQRKNQACGHAPDLESVGAIGVDAMLLYPALWGEQTADVAESHGNGREIFAEKGKCLLAGERCVAKIVPNGKIRRSEEHTSELQSLMRISYAVFCLKNKKQTNNE